MIKEFPSLRRLDCIPAGCIKRNLINVAKKKESYYYSLIISLINIRNHKKIIHSVRLEAVKLYKIYNYFQSFTIVFTLWLILLGMSL